MKSVENLLHTKRERMAIHAGIVVMKSIRGTTCTILSVYVYVNSLKNSDEMMEHHE